MSTGQVTTFYSYKGGVGRTFLLANVAWLLARWGRRVLCVDWDLEAPGLHHYLSPFAPPRRGVYDLVLALAGSDKDPSEWRQWREELTGPWSGRGCLHLLRAGEENDAYRSGVQALNWAELSKLGFNTRLEDVRAEWVDPEHGYDHILVDSRTGITDIGGICAAQLPDLLVLVFTATLQSLHGARTVEGLARTKRAQLPLDRGSFQVLTVPCRVHTGEEEALEKEWSAHFAAFAEPLMQPWLGRGVRIEEYLAHLRIREQARWSFGEHLPVREEALDDPNRISWNFANVAALIATGLDRSEQIVTRRRDLLTELAGEAGLAAPSGDQAPSGAHRDVQEIFISYSQAERETARALHHKLRMLGHAATSDVDIPLGVDLSEWLYRARERAAMIVILISGKGLGPNHQEELAHVNRLRADSGVTVVPVFLDPDAIRVAPSWLRSIFGLTPQSGQDSVDEIAAQIARAAARSAPRSSPWF